MANGQESLFETIGDFVVNEQATDAAEEQMAERSNASQRRDKQKRAPVTTNYNKWKSDTDHWDYPGVDTPTEDPRVLPKDLKQSEKPRTTDPNTGKKRGAGVTPMSGQELEHEQFQAQATSADVSLSPGEGLKGVGFEDPQAIGGNVLGNGEIDRPDHMTTPPDQNKTRLPESSQDDVGFFYEVKDLAGDVDPQDFKRDVRRKKREFGGGGVVDDFTAAGLVIDDYES